MKKAIIIAAPALIIVLIVVFFMLKPSSRNNYVALSREFVEFENNWVKIPKEFGLINKDGSLTFPAEYVNFEKKDSVDNLNRTSYINEAGDSVPYLYYKKEIINTRTVITPGSNQIRISSKDYTIQGAYLFIKPEIFQAGSRIIKFYETPSAKLSALKIKTDSKFNYWYILLGVVILGIGGYIYWRYTHEDIVKVFKKLGVEMTYEELQKYLKPGYDFEELAYMIKIYHSKAKSIGFTYDMVVKNVHPEPIGTLTEGMSEDEAKLLKNMQKLERNKFEKLLATLENAKKEDPKIKTTDLLKLHQNKFDVSGTFDAHQTLTAGGANVPLKLMWRLKTPSTFKFNLDNISKMGKSVELDKRLHKYQNPGVIEELIKVFYDLLKADIEVEFDDLEKHFLNGGHVDKLVNSIILLKNARMSDISYQDLANIDLSGFNLDDVVPKAIKPAIEKFKYDEILTHDKVKLEVEAELTYRFDLKYYINTAGLPTLNARIDEAMHSAIGSLETHLDALKNPAKITKSILKLNLDEGTSLLVVSLNITKIKIKEESTRRRHTGYHGHEQSH